MTPLQRFRAYMARMSPSGDPQAAMRDGLYVPPPGRSVADDLAMRLELEPASTHLVLGGIGSGKTSELLRAAERLRSSADATGDHIEYFDVSRQHDLSAGGLSGVLVALAGESLRQEAQRRNIIVSHSALAASLREVQQFALGKTELFLPSDGLPFEELYADNLIRTPGAIVSPDSSLPDGLRRVSPHLRTICQAYPGDGHHTLFLFDSLDRLPSPERFRAAVEHDLRVLRAASIGVVVVGPVRFMAGTNRALADLFDHTHFQLAMDPEQPEGRTFLTEVLRRRAAADLLPDECLEPLASASGGVMRDLLALAKRAGEEAYAAGHDYITSEDVARAVDAFGRSLAIGLDNEQVQQIRHVQRGSGFVIRGERELSLLETRRVLLYEQSRWAVHPALVPLLDAIPEAA
jgi:hypothetical protein